MADELLVCPYDESHVIHPLRMPRHLLKCRKNHSSVDLAVCPFNGFHEVPPPELRYHMRHCPDKTLLDKDLDLDSVLRDPDGDQIRKKPKGFTELPKYSNRNILGSEDELWDTDQDQYEPVVQRNRQQARRRDEQESSLRLPNRDGTVARRAHGLSVSRGRNTSRLEQRTNSDTLPDSSSLSSHFGRLDVQELEDNLSDSQSNDSPQTSPLQVRVGSQPSEKIVKSAGEYREDAETPGLQDVKQNLHFLGRGRALNLLRRSGLANQGRPGIAVGSALSSSSLSASTLATTTSFKPLSSSSAFSPAGSCMTGPGTCSSNLASLIQSLGKGRGLLHGPTNAAK